MGRQFSYGSVYFGCDPEFFFSKDGKVIGSEKVIDEGGLKSTRGSAKPAFVRDGVQVELNPAPDPCRANLGNRIKSEFIALKNHLKNTPDIKANFSSVINLDPAELESLSEKSKVFGCAPSINKYDNGAEIKIDARTYMKRAAGGHIHLGLNKSTKEYVERERLIPLMDILVGNTCVLIDRDPEASTRRLHYGRAGEYRLPEHGIEYRTLSNFWLRSYQLMSLVMGLSRMATGILFSTINPPGKQPINTYKNVKGYDGRLMYPTYTDEYWDKMYPPENYIAFDFEYDLLSRVNMDSVLKAINTNDLELAKVNFEGVKAFLKDHNPSFNNMGITYDTIPAFEFFCQKVQEHGLEYWFPEDPLKHWCNIPEGHETGWESFLKNKVTPKMTKELDAIKASEQLNLAYIAESPEIYVDPVIIKRVYERDELGRFKSKNNDVTF